MATLIETPAPAPAQGAGALVRARASDRRRVLVDRIARGIVTAGGLAIVASVLGILLFITWEVLPLLRGARVTPTETIELADGRGATAVIADEHRTHLAFLDARGRVAVSPLTGATRIAPRPLLGPRAEGAASLPVLTSIASVAEDALLAGASDDGRVAAVPVAWDVSFEGDRRVVTPTLGETIVFDLDPSGRPLGPFSVRTSDRGAAAAAVTADGRVAVVLADVEENAITGELTRSERRTEVSASGKKLAALVLDRDRRNLYGGTATGEILWWRIVEGDVQSPEVVSGSAPAITTMSLLIGDRTLVVGREDGTLAAWYPVRGGDEAFRLTSIRDFPAVAGSVRSIAPSPRDKSFVVLDATGGAALYHSTSGRLLRSARTRLSDATAVSFAPKSDAVLVSGGGRAEILTVDSPHPETSFGTLFGKVWYEGYPEPAYVWQSTGGTDDFEPKLSLTPLAFGTLKGTIYSLLLAIPLGVLGAMYAAHFMHPSLKRIVKPTVEIMAALPSVVLGFLAGLWLAPIVDARFPALVLMGPVVTLAILATGLAWRSVPGAVRQRLPGGFEVALYGLVVVAGAWACLALEPWVETVAFGGNFQAWLLETTGLTYDQRNAIVVGLAMGFAVIPIIFAISEDAFANVPPNLVAGSLALGANRWQTVTRVVLPTASPGIFSAVMVGFGRAVGETMVVLMATGNTPIIDWSPFNGFRTLSANIAVEIPEAPVGGTLYRALFLAALLLFVVTFVLNTIAELVRQRLRRRFAQL